MIVQVIKGQHNKFEQNSTFDLQYSKLKELT